MAKYELWINLYDGYGYTVYATEAQAERGRGSRFIECRKIEWESKEPTRVADYLVPHSSTKCRPYVVTLFGNPDGDPIRDELFFKQTHPVGQQPEGAILVPGSERET